MDNGRNEVCGNLLEYVSGGLTAEQRDDFTNHLEDCPSCRTGLSRIREAWDLLPLTAEPLDLPPGLKSAVMQNVQEREREDSGSPRKRRHLPWIYAVSAAVFVVLVGTIFNLRMLADYREQAGKLPAVPSTIEKLVMLEAENASAAQSYGFACVVNRGDVPRLVVYVFGAEQTVGDQAYQVWLTKDGHRINGGTFRVGETGIGVLTSPISGETAFDTVGITLEPDAEGISPRGSRVFRSMNGMYE